MIWQRFTAKIANNSLFKTSKRWKTVIHCSQYLRYRKHSMNCTSWNNIGVQTSMETFLSYEKFTHLLHVRQLCKLCWWKIFAKIHRQSLQIALIFKILFQKPTRLSVFGKKFDPADLVTRDVSSLLLSCLCSIYFGFYKVNMAGNTRFYNTRQNKTVWAFVNWNGNKIDKFLATKKRF